MLEHKLSYTVTHVTSLASASQFSFGLYLGSTLSWPCWHSCEENTTLLTARRGTYYWWLWRGWWRTSLHTTHKCPTGLLTARRGTYCWWLWRGWWRTSLHTQVAHWSPNGSPWHLLLVTVTCLMEDISTHTSVPLVF